MDQTGIKGINLQDLLEFYEEEKMNGHYQSLTHKEVTEVRGGTLDTSLIELLFTGAVSVVTALVTDYFQKSNKHEVTYELKNSKGEKMTITLKNVSSSELPQIMDDFENR